MRKFIFLLLLVSLAGCGRDAASLSVATGLSVDLRDDRCDVTAEVIRLSDSAGDESCAYLTASAPTITEALDEMVAVSGHSLYCNHAQVLIIGKEAAEAGVSSILEELMAGTQYPVSLKLAVADDLASQILRAAPVLSDVHSTELRDLLKEGAEHGLAPDVSLNDFQKSLAKSGADGALPLLCAERVGDETVCRLSGTALFSGDRLIAALNEEDSRALSWMQGRGGGFFSVNDAAIRVTRVRPKLSADAHGAVLHLDADFSVRNRQEQGEKLIHSAESAIQAQCEHVLRLLQQNSCDALGIGIRIGQIHPDEWSALESSWYTIFPHYPVRIETEAREIVWGRIVPPGGEQQEVNRYR